MRTREEILKEINVLEDKYNKSRNVVERARYTAQIKELRVEFDSIENKHEQKVVFQNDAPSVADHKENSRRIVRGDIGNAGDSFVGIL